LNPSAAWDEPAYTQVTHSSQSGGKKKKGSSSVMGRSVHTEKYRFTQWADQGEELYDHGADAEELHNLAKSPEHAITVEQMRKLLAGGRPE
jgi:hypothetical protein